MDQEGMILEIKGILAALERETRRAATQVELDQLAIKPLHEADVILKKLFDAGLRQTDPTFAHCLGRFDQVTTLIFERRRRLPSF